ncbi:MAG: MFS transporter, partial [Alphaproteobacteria bacterium]|nr:MFS transporter [Alphaproteobacteria bacterium]
GEDAGLVLGTALAIKMIAYVGIAPIVGGYANLLPRRHFLIGLDMARASVALVLPFVDQVWQIYVLIFLLQSASAAFTPTFQATIPDIIPDEREYTEALSLSRLAYDLESLLSPALAAALLTVISFHWLFAGTTIGFLISAGLVLSVTLPIRVAAERKTGIWERTTRGIRTYLATPRLRGLLSLNLAAAAGGAMVIINTVVYVRGTLQGSESDVAFALASFGGGSLAVALLLPPILDRLSDRTVMLAGGGGLALGLAAFAMQSVSEQIEWTNFLIYWLFFGGCYSVVLTPSGRLLKRSSVENSRPELFAAQFALSHACWLLTYPVAGWLGSQFSWATAFAVFAAVSGTAFLAALVVWPVDDPDALMHEHSDLDPDDPHLVDAEKTGTGFRHVHHYAIDERHDNWPRGT